MHGMNEFLERTLQIHTFGFLLHWDRAYVRKTTTFQTVTVCSHILNNINVAYSSYVARERCLDFLYQEKTIHVQFQNP